MFKKLFGRGARGAAPFYRPYRNDAMNHIYNLLFCDNPVLFSQSEAIESDLSAVLSPAADRDTLNRIANDLGVESRVRALAFNRLRSMRFSVPSKRLLGAIIEVPQNSGLDVLAIFSDQRLRYINHSETLAVFEESPPNLTAKADEVLRASQFVVNRYGPWTQPRRPPPTGELVRMSFLASDGLYFGEGRFNDLFQDRFAAPVINSASELLHLVVDAALEKDRESKS